MRLLYLMTEPFGIGGVQSDILALTEELSRRGHEVHVATTAGVLLEELKLKGAHHVAIDFNFTSLGGFLRAARALRECVFERDIEMVAPQSVRSTFVAWTALRLARWIPLLNCESGVMPIVSTIHNIHNPAHFAYAGHLLHRCCDYVIFESHYERNRLLKSGLHGAESEVIHSGIDTERFQPRPRDDALAARYGVDPSQHKVFGIVARLSEEKGHKYLVEAFTRVHRQCPDARLMVVGEGPLLAEVQAQVAQAGLADVVIFTGMQRDIPKFLALFDVFVLASTRESFPLAAREAMAAGKPVIAPRIGGCPEVVDEGRTGYLFDARDVAELADCMCKLLEGDRASIFGRAARHRAVNLFSRRSWVDGDERVYMRFAKEK